MARPLLIRLRAPALLVAAATACGDSTDEHDASSGLPGDSGVTADATSGDGASGAPDSSSSDGTNISDAIADADASQADAGSLVLPSPLRGVTVDDISNVSAVVTALSALPHKPTARIVFDETQAPAYYAQAAASIHGAAYVLGEILDSQYVSTVTPAQYTQRTSDYLAALSADVDLWEVGNEINGNWLGTTSDVAAKMSGAFDMVKAAGGHTELTLYGCTDSGPAYDMITWAQANVPQRMLTGLDYVLVSYYEGDCGAPRTDWMTPFQQLRALFPNAGLGFGEVGYVDKNGSDLALQSEAAAATYLQKYYGMQAPVAGYVGGYFWWYFAEDMVPKSQPLFAVLSAALQ